MHGWIRFPRKQFSAKWFSQKPFCRGYAWTYLCAMAAHTPIRAGEYTDIIDVKRGQLLTSITNLAAQFGWSRSRVTRFLGALKADKVIDTQRISQFMLISINNYDDYHGFENHGNFETLQGPRTPRTGDGHSPDTYKKKNYNNNKKHFAPDSCEIRLAKCLLTEIRKHDPAFRDPHLPSWAQLLCQHARLNLYDFTARNTPDEFYERALAKTSELIGRKLFMAEAPGVSAAELRALAITLAQSEHIRLLFIDHLGEIHEPRENLYHKITDVSTSLRALALEIHIPVIALCQLSRAVTSRENKTPVLSDLRDSGALEQQADKVIFLHRPNYYREVRDREKLEGEGNPEHIEVVVAKNRDGKTGFVQLVYYEDWGRIEEE